MNEQLCQINFKLELLDQSCEDCLNMKKNDILLRFKMTSHYCWNWKGNVALNGYGRICIKGKFYYAHRYFYMKHIGKIPKGMFVCHTCDHPICVNPKHLFLGTAKDNSQDAVKKGRVRIPRASYASSDKHQVAKLTNRQVKIIRSGKYKGAELARRFNVTQNTISLAKTRKTFRDIK